MELWHKIQRWWIKFRLQPIRVFCFHQVSETFDSNVYCKPDWISTHDFKAQIEKLQYEGYQFIALEQAYEHIKRDIFRFKKYAVLTADDGLRCQLELVPWLEAHKVPITLFVNVETLSGDVCGRPMKEYFQMESKEEESRHAKQLYFVKEDIDNVSPIVSIGMHGVNHDEVTHLSNEEFNKAVNECISKIGVFDQYIPFYAYTFGRYSSKTDAILHQLHIVPVLTDGGENYNDLAYIHREIIEEKF